MSQVSQDLNSIEEETRGVNVESLVTPFEKHLALPELSRNRSCPEFEMYLRDTICGGDRAACDDLVQRFTHLV